MAREKTTDHPHIVCIKGICGGKPIIKGTRTPVRSIVGYYKLGMSVEEIVEGLPQLTPAQVYDALSYYHDHYDEIEQDVQRNRLENVIKRYNLKLDRDQRLVPKGSNKNG